ncbi:MAG TPA: hypothetical protein ENH82_09555 [bacterium]|nr:hypothetical protein [bacterium]
MSTNEISVLFSKLKGAIGGAIDKKGFKGIVPDWGWGLNFIIFKANGRYFKIKMERVDMENDPDAARFKDRI